MSLHNHNNFTFKDVTKIQNNIIANLTKTMASMLTKLNQTQVVDTIIKSKLNKLSTVFSNPFQFCSTEYRLEKWLVQNNYVTDAQQFTIHSEVSTIKFSGESVFGENTTKGVHR